MKKNGIKRKSFTTRSLIYDAKNKYVLINNFLLFILETQKKHNIIKHKSYETRIEKLNYVFYEQKKQDNNNNTETELFQVILCELFFSYLEKKSFMFFMFFFLSENLRFLRNLII